LIDEEIPQGQVAERISAVERFSGHSHGPAASHDALWGNNDSSQSTQKDFFWIYDNSRCVLGGGGWKYGPMQLTAQAKMFSFK